MPKKTQAMLTPEQKAAAEKLLAERPAVVPNTRAIVSESKAAKWHDAVTAKMQALDVPDHLVIAFCDAAGVAD